MFQPARWKAYLKDLHESEADGKGHQSILQIFHSEKLWFTRQPNNGHADSAEAHIKESTEVLKDCTEKNDALEETLANTPKPSEVLDWSRLW